MEPLTSNPLAKRIAMVECAGGKAAPRLEITFKTIEDMHAASDFIRGLSEPPPAQASKPHAVAPPDCPVSDDQYTRNMLDSLAGWLESRSQTAWAKEYGHDDLMQTYGSFLRRFTARRAEPPTELDAEDDQALGALEEYMKTSGTAGNWSRQVWELINRLRAAQPSPSDAARDVLAERERQKNVEGWTPEHDDTHNTGELAEAAACYVLNTYGSAPDGVFDRIWPWSLKWWKPKDRRRDLVRAAALLIADIERIDRQASTKSSALPLDDPSYVMEPGEHR